MRARDLLRSSSLSAAADAEAELSVLDTGEPTSRRIREAIERARPEVASALAAARALREVTRSVTETGRILAVQAQLRLAVAALPTKVRDEWRGGALALLAVIALALLMRR